LKKKQQLLAISPFPYFAVLRYFKRNSPFLHVLLELFSFSLHLHFVHFWVTQGSEEDANANVDSDCDVIRIAKKKNNNNTKSD